MIPFALLIALLAAAIVFFVALKCKNSPKFSKFVDKVTEDQTIAPSPKQVIKDIGKKEQALTETAKKMQKDAEKLTDDSDKIGDYLASRDGKPDKEKEEPIE